MCSILYLCFFSHNADCNLWLATGSFCVTTLAKYSQVSEDLLNWMAGNFYNFHILLITVAFTFYFLFYTEKFLILHKYLCVCFYICFWEGICFYILLYAESIISYKIVFLPLSSFQSANGVRNCYMKLSRGKDGRGGQSGFKQGTKCNVMWWATW